MPALCLTKLTTLVYLRALSPESRFEIANTMLEAFIILWGLAAEFAIAFQCKLSSPWAIISGKCFETVHKFPNNAPRIYMTKRFADFVLESQWSCRYTDRCRHCPAAIVSCLVSSDALEKKGCGHHGLWKSDLVSKTSPYSSTFIALDNLLMHQ